MRKSRKAYLIFCLILVVGYVQAGTQFFGQGVYQMGKANTGIASPNGPSSIAYNPGLSSFVPSAFSFSAGMQHHRMWFQVENSPADYLEYGNTFPVSFFANYRPGKKNWSLNLGFYQLMSQELNWPSDWIGRNVVHEYSTRDYVLQPGFSYQFNERLSFGVGLQIHFIDVLYSRSFQSLSPGNPESIMALDDWFPAISGQVGLFYRINSRWQLGLSAQLPVFYGKDSSRVFRYPEAFMPGFVEEAASFNSQIPWNIGLGVQYSPMEALSFSLDLSYIHYKAMDSLIIEAGANYPLRDIHEAWFQKSGFQMKFGTEVDMGRLWSWRGGISFESGRAKTGSVRPDLSFNKLLGLTTGTTVFFSEVIEADVSVAYFRYLEVNEPKDINYLGFGGQFHGHSVWASVGLRVNFRNQQLLRERIRNF